MSDTYFPPESRSFESRERAASVVTYLYCSHCGMARCEDMMVRAEAAEKERRRLFDVLGRVEEHMSISRGRLRYLRSIVKHLVDRCPRCGAPLEWGYGLAGGGMGAYVACTSDNDCPYLKKRQDQE